ncbi:hypothetical protein BYT27DRAFT_7256320 [Phlegmacium glaucopus]|nr:hypothetical protein BYT27DRAFT_7256320 [Phlegmacium glaucopus]
MSDLNTIRAEIKNWERSFKQTRNRPPTVDDIKKDNVIADRYKQYKKLSKALAPLTTSLGMKSTAPPSTPPRITRPKDPPSLIPSRSRVVELTVPLNAFNPFSPQKKPKGKDTQKDIDHDIQSGLETHSNSFGKARAQARTRSLSPNSFPLVNQIQPSSSPSSSVFYLNPPQMPASAVSRARKRLRGEPVSPSPNKDKRRRVLPPTAISFPRLNFNAADSDDEKPNMDTSFVDNSPLKAPFSGKSFSRLFDESVASLDTSNSQDLSRSCIDDIAGPSMHGAANSTKHAKEVLGKRQFTKLDASQASLVHFITTQPSESVAIPGNGNIPQAKSAFSANRSSAKRPFSDEPEPANIPRTRSPLLPPSPPPANTSCRASAKPLQRKGNSKASKGRKKMKSDEKPNNHDSDDPELTATLRIVNRKTTRPLHAVGDVDDFQLHSDSILGYTRSAALHPSSPITDPQDHGSIEVDLPDKLRSVLALRSSASKSQVSEEDQLVKGLLYGRRVTHYDPNKGGEIWDAGEDDLGGLDEDRNRYTDREDEWECEPVPWEVGEL